MKNTLIQDFSTAIVKGFYYKMVALKHLEHKPTNGELKELFFKDLLNEFLTSQFGVGTGVVIDSKGNSSKQIDLIIYDNRLLPPFIKNGNIGVFPLEAVLAIIEIKTTLDKSRLLQTENNFKDFDERMEFLDSFNNNIAIPSVLKGVIGLNNKSIKVIDKDNSDWLNYHIKHIDSICLMQHFSWIKYPSSKKWFYCYKNEVTFEETKRFIAWMLDNCRSKSNKRTVALSQKYIPWLSHYIRNQNIID